MRQIAKLPVNPPHHLVHVLQQSLVLHHLAPRGHGDLHVRHLVDPVLVALEKTLEGHELVHDALYVVQAIDADDDLHVAVPVAQVLGDFGEVVAFYGVFEALDVDPDREGVDHSHFVV